MKVTTQALLGFLLVSLDGASSTSIKMDYLPAGFARTDPIISQTCLSDHVHTFYGPQKLRPETDHSTLINTPVAINSGNVEENKSLYWHPTVYSYNRVTDTYTRDEMSLASAYYIWENDTNTRAFPNGFRMIAGMNPTDPANFPNAEAGCAGESRCSRSDGCATENSFFPSTACEELEVSMTFPSCWDGRLDSDNHQDHVHYTLDGEVDGPCPGSHPLRLPRIELFFRIAPYSGGWHTFSDGSSVFHADYMSGWDETFLQNVIDNCRTESLGSNPDSFCENFLTFRDAPKCSSESNLDCSFDDANIISKLQGFQPPPLDVKGTISPEETRVVKTLPRGTCTGTLLPQSGSPPTNSPPTNVPVASPTRPPAFSPTNPPVGGDNDGDEDGDGDMDEEPDEGVDDEDADETGDEDDEEMDGDMDEENMGEDGDEDWDGDMDEEPDDEVDGEDGDADETGGGDDEESDGDMDEDNTGDDEDGIVSSPNAQPTMAPVLAPSNTCKKTCSDRFVKCEGKHTRRCNTEHERCESDCFLAQKQGEISSDGLTRCLGKRCGKALRRCQKATKSKCRGKRRKCIRKCQKARF